MEIIIKNFTNLGGVRSPELNLISLIYDKKLYFWVYFVLVLTKVFSIQGRYYTDADIARLIAWSIRVCEYIIGEKQNNMFAHPALKIVIHFHKQLLLLSHVKINKKKDGVRRMNF